jgi:hypothetical protein
VLIKSTRKGAVIMPQQKLSDEEFLLRIMPYLGQRKPSYKQMARLSGLSMGGARYKMEKLIREGRLAVTASTLTVDADKIGEGGEPCLQ